MAYQTPPSFIPSSVLTSAQLNILSSNDRHFWGLVNGYSGGFNTTRVQSSDLNLGNWSYTLPKLARFLVWRLAWYGGSFQAQLWIRVDHYIAATNTYNLNAYSYMLWDNGTPTDIPNGTPVSPPYSWTGPTFDLDDAGYSYDGEPGIPYGDLMRVWVQMENDSNNDFEITYMFNRGHNVL